MTLKAKLLSLSPGLILGSAALCVLWAVIASSPWPLLAVPLVLYGVPPLAYRVHDRLWPLKEGPAYLVNEGYIPWYGGHQLQLIYVALPSLEAMLRLLPGVYSAWLRLWGSQVGRGVYWTPVVQVLDRGMVEIGDGAILGHGVVIFSHVIKPAKKDGELLLFVKKVRIGAGVLLGAGVYMGPGVVVADGSMVPATTHLFPNARWPE
jgi:hypothetical protein